jgi:hypothetical protein
VSLAALRETSRRRAATWPALGASVLSIVIGVVPFFALPFDPS